MTHWQNRLALLRIPAFRWYLLSCIFATIGAGLSYIAMIWLVLQDRNSVGAVAMVMICFWTPGVFLGPFIGVLVDRFPYRSLLLAASNGIRALALLIFGYYLLHHNTLHGIYVLILVLGTFFSVYIPAAFRLTREIVPDDKLLHANATIDMVYEVGNLVGMGFAGICIALFTAPGAIIINGVTFLVSTLMLILIPRSQLKITTDKNASLSIIKDFTTTFSYLNANRLLCILYTMQLLLFVEYLTAPVLLAPFAKNMLHTNAAQFGWLESSLSVGVIIGGILIPWLNERIGFYKLIFISSVILGLSYLGFSYNRTFLIACAIYFTIGLTFATWPLVITSAQNNTNVVYQGRVQSCFTSVSGIIMLSVYFLVKAYSHTVSIASFYWLEIAFTALILLLLWLNRDALIKHNATD